MTRFASHSPSLRPSEQECTRSAYLKGAQTIAMECRTSEADFIKSLHARLRKRYKEVGDEAVTWAEHLKNEDQLQSYAVSMQTLAEEQWKSRDNTNRIEWCREICNDYFHNGGYDKVKQKEQRKLWYDLLNNAISCLGDKEKADCPKTSREFRWRFQGDDEKLYLLDVGSCYNPFEAHRDQFNVVALDLYPSRKDVYKADFLALEVAKQYTVNCEDDTPTTTGVVEMSSEDEPNVCYHRQTCATSSCPVSSALCVCDTVAHHHGIKSADLCGTCFVNHLVVTSTNFLCPDNLMSEIDNETLSTPSTTRTKELTESENCNNRQRSIAGIDRRHCLSSLPSSCFDVAVFSLFLSYFPSPRQRMNCCLKARDLLREDGLLIVIESDSSHVNRNVRMIKSWKQTLEKMGFLRYRYEKHKHLHCMAFRKVAAKCLPDLIDPESMFIPQDFQELCFAELSLNEVGDSANEEENKLDFHLLPSFDVEDET